MWRFTSALLSSCLFLLRSHLGLSVSPSTQRGHAELLNKARSMGNEMVVRGSKRQAGGEELLNSGTNRTNGPVQVDVHVKLAVEALAGARHASHASQKEGQGVPVEVTKGAERMLKVTYTEFADACRSPAISWSATNGNSQDGVTWDGGDMRVDWCTLFQAVDTEHECTHITMRSLVTNVVTLNVMEQQAQAGVTPTQEEISQIVPAMVQGMIATGSAPEEGKMSADVADKLVDYVDFDCVKALPGSDALEVALCVAGTGPGRCYVLTGEVDQCLHSLFVPGRRATLTCAEA